MKQAEKNIWRSFFLIFFCAVFLFVFVQILCFNQSFGYAPALQIALMVLFCAGAALGAGLLWRAGWLQALPRHKYKVLVCALVFLLGVQYFVGISTVQSLDHDVGKVFHGALTFVTKGAQHPDFEVYRAYLHRWTNNMGEFTLLAGLFALLQALGLSCYYEATVLVGHLCFTAAVALTFFYVDKAFGTWPALGSLALWLAYPVVYVQSSCVYTDTFSIWCAPLVLCLWQWGKEKNTFKRAVFWGAGGVVLAIGMHIKGTVLLLLPALLCEALASKQSKRLLAAVLCLGLGFGLGQGALTALDYALVLEPERVEAQSMPATFWVMMGLAGENGSYTDLDGMLVDWGKTQAEKQAIIKREITNRLQERGSLGYVQFLQRKLGRSFGSGNGDVAYMLNRGVSNPEHSIYEIVLPTGRFYRYFDAINQCVYLLFYVFGVIGAMHLMRRKGVAAENIAPYIALLGFVAFMLLWESNHRQLVNQWPLYIIIGAVGLTALGRRLKTCLQRQTARIAKPAAQSEVHASSL